MSQACCQALRKFGFGAGLSVFMLLGVADLACMVGQRMRQMEGDNKLDIPEAKKRKLASGPSQNAR